VILHGDCVEQMALLPEASIDACVTDPPYELGFMGKKWDKSGIAFNAYTWRAVYRVLKPGAHLLAFGGTRTFHRIAVAIEDAGFDIRDSIAWLQGQGFPKSLNLGDGLGTALKPAFEPVILARKPFKGAVAANVQRHGTGALNIDATRIVTDDDRSRPPRTANAIYGAGAGTNTTASDSHPLGRWPANVCLDEHAAACLDEMSGEMGGGEFAYSGIRAMRDNPVYGAPNTTRHSPDNYGDIGGASRFFYCAKPSREERDYGLAGFRPLSGGEATNRTDGTAGLENPRAGAGRTGGGRNGHPTVKPVELMRWLVRLVTPINGTVLDPFLGSGTTGMACRYELREFIGIEREAEYIAIAERRIAAVAPLFNEQSA